MNQSLPIHAFREEIMESVKKNQVTLITAETAAGKSTQVPQFLLEGGYQLVVTQPRRLAARTVAQRVAFEMKEELGETIGLRTRDDRIVGPNNRCLFATDGLAMVRELMAFSTKEKILVLDEVHEWNLNMEVIVAWTKLQIKNGANFRAVLMSATLESAELSTFFGGAPVINVPGRQFPVETQTPARELELDVVNLVARRRNVLVFQPGKAEIQATIKKLTEEYKINAEILPLHGELGPEEQARCFRHYGRPKVVVATNVAQTSVTIDDIDAVVDSGMEKRIELVGGVQGLYTKPISYADSSQRKGRAGRTKPGIYIDHCSSAYRDEFPTAEILRTRLDQTVLRLAAIGINAEELEFFHQPDRTQIHEARETLKALGCMDENDAVTKIGHRIINDMPINVKWGRMIIEAERLGVVGDIIDIAAILEHGQEITDRKSILWNRLTEGERESDLIAQLKVFREALEMDKTEMTRNGIIPKSFFKVREIRTVLRESLTGKVASMESTGNRENIMKAVIAGMVDHVYIHSFGEHYTNGSGRSRKINKNSVVTPSEWLVGVPFDLHLKVKDDWGFDREMVYHLINLITNVRIEWLGEIAPQVYHIETGVDPELGIYDEDVYSYKVVYFKGRELERTRVHDPNHPAASSLKAERRRQQEEQARFRMRLLRAYGLNRLSPTPIDPEAEVRAAKATEISGRIKALKSEAEKLLGDKKSFKALDAFERTDLATIKKGPSWTEDSEAWLNKWQAKFDKIKPTSRR